jgi:hypothetical protein
MDPVVLTIDPQGGLIHVQGGLGEELVDCWCALKIDQFLAVMRVEN